MSALSENSIVSGNGLINPSSHAPIPDDFPKSIEGGSESVYTERDQISGNDSVSYAQNGVDFQNRNHPLDEGSYESETILPGHSISQTGTSSTSQVGTSSRSREVVKKKTDVKPFFLNKLLSNDSASKKYRFPYRKDWNSMISDYSQDIDRAARRMFSLSSSLVPSISVMTWKHLMSGDVDPIEAFNGIRFKVPKMGATQKEREKMDVSNPITTNLDFHVSFVKMIAAHRAVFPRSDKILNAYHSWFYEEISKNPKWCWEEWRELDYEVRANHAKNEGFDLSHVGIEPVIAKLISELNERRSRRPVRSASKIEKRNFKYCYGFNSAEGCLDKDCPYSHVCGSCRASGHTDLKCNLKKLKVRNK